MDFGLVIVGERKQVELQMRNVGRGEIDVTRVEPGADFPAEFRFTPRSFKISPGAAAKLILIFEPGAEGAKLGELQLFTSGQPEIATLDIKGTGFIPRLTASAETLDFGEVVVGDSSQRSFTVTNSGSSPVTALFDALAGENPDSFRTAAAAPDPTHVQLAPGQSVAIDATFLPRVAGTHRARLVVRGCQNCEPINVSFTGHGIESSLLLDPCPLDFGSVLPGQTTVRELNIRNVGNKRVQLLAVKPAQTPSDFAVQAIAGGLPELGPLDEVKVRIAYSPQGLGSDSNTLHVDTNDTRAPRLLCGMTGYGGGPSIEVSPAAIGFGDVAVGFPVKRRVTLRNRGTSDPTTDKDNLHIETVNLEQGNAFEFQWAFAGGRQIPLTLQPGEAAVLEATYAPRDEGLDAEGIVIGSNDPLRPTVTVPLTGTGHFLLPCEYEIAPPPSPGLEFGVVPRGRSLVLDFAIRNIGTHDCIVLSLELDPTSTGYALPNGEITGRLLPAGEQLLVPVSFNPPGTVHSPTDFLGKAIVQLSNDREPLQEVLLRGRAAEVCLQITPDLLDFGTVSPGCETNDRTFTIYNTCLGTVTVQRAELGPGASSEFRVLPPTPNFPRSITPQNKLDVATRYKPTDVGPDGGSIYVFTDQSLTAGRPYVLQLSGRGETDATQTDLFTQADRPKADILFVVDNSGSMDNEQQNLSANFGSFIAFATQQNVDYQIAVTTTDVDDCSSAGSGECGRFVPVPPTTNPRIVGPGLPDPESAFRVNTTVGTNGSGNEQGLEAMYLALSDPLINTENAGFLRPDAYLSVIFVGDEDDQSPRPLDFYANFLQNIHGARNSNRVSASAISGGPAGCGGADASPRFNEMVARTGGIWESICTNNWAAALQRLGLSAFGYKSTFILSSQPDRASLQVRLQPAGSSTFQSVAGSSDCALPPQGYWCYDAQTNSIDFDPTAVPEAGAQVEVTYSVACN